MDSDALIDEAPDPAPSLAREGPRKQILIAGAGIGGLAAALALAKRGIASHVFERKAAFAEEGAGIQIGPNGTKILAHLGVADALGPYVAVPQAIRILDAATGSDLARLPLGRWIHERHGAPYWVAHRHDLHAALLKRAREHGLIRLSTGADIVSALSDSHRIAVRMADGRTWGGDALIAADGLWSRLRTTLIDPTPPRSAGKSAARSVVSRDAVPARLRNNETHLWLAPSAHVVHYPVRAGAETAIVAIFDEREAADGWSTAIDPGWVLSRAKQFPPELRELLSQPRSWRKWSLQSLPGRRSWVRGRVALLGDAAHPVLPFLAQGGVLALEDAVVLAEALSSTLGEDIPRGLREYERRRLARVRRVERASRWNGRIYHVGGIAASIRNAVISAAPPERLMASYDWLYGWAPPSLSSNARQDWDDG
jgi:salicylate hydroxylase